MASKYVIHAYQPPDAEFLTLFLDDKVFRLPPFEPVEIDRDSNGRALDTPEFYHFELIRQYGNLFGLTEVPMEKTRNGVTLDVEGAVKKAEDSLLMNRHRRVNQWAADEIKNRVSKNLPVMAPSGFIAESIRELNIDLRATYQFNPVGWDFKADPAKSPANSDLLTLGIGEAARDEEVAGLKAQVSQLTDLVTQLLDRSTAADTQTKPSKQK